MPTPRTAADAPTDATGPRTGAKPRRLTAALTGGLALVVAAATAAPHRSLVVTPSTFKRGDRVQIPADKSMLETLRALPGPFDAATCLNFIGRNGLGS